MSNPSQSQILPPSNNNTSSSSNNTSSSSNNNTSSSVTILESLFLEKESYHMDILNSKSYLRNYFWRMKNNANTAICKLCKILLNIQKGMSGMKTHLSYKHADQQLEIENGTANTGTKILQKIKSFKGYQQASYNKGNRKEKKI